MCGNAALLCPRPLYITSMDLRLKLIMISLLIYRFGCNTSPSFLVNILFVTFQYRVSVNNMICTTSAAFGNAWYTKSCAISAKLVTLKLKPKQTLCKAKHFKMYKIYYTLIVNVSKNCGMNSYPNLTQGTYKY